MTFRASAEPSFTLFKVTLDARHLVGIIATSALSARLVPQALKIASSLK
jgi:hypothetical protein